MSQVGKTSEGKRALQVTIQRVTGPKTDDGRAIPAAITVQAPLGILIPYGLRIKIDSDKVVPLPLLISLTFGKTLSAISSARNVSLTVRSTTGTGTEKRVNMS